MLRPAKMPRLAFARSMTRVCFQTLVEEKQYIGFRNVKKVTPICGLMDALKHVLAEGEIGFKTEVCLI